MRTIRLLSALAIALLGACATPGPLHPGLDLNEGDTALRTEQPRYRATRAGDQLVLDVGFRYTNPAASPRYVARCHTPHPPVLQKWTGSEWVVAYAPVVLRCWQEPITIAPGATYTDTLRVRASLSGSSIPEFRVRPVAGTYRLAWRLLRSAHIDQQRDAEVEVSNSFEITE